MFVHPKDNFLTKKARINFEAYGQDHPITSEAGKKASLLSLLKISFHQMWWFKY